MSLGERDLVSVRVACGIEAPDSGASNSGTSVLVLDRLAGNGHCALPALGEVRHGRRLDIARRLLPELDGEALRLRFLLLLLGLLGGRSVGIGIGVVVLVLDGRGALVEAA